MLTNENEMIIGIPREGFGFCYNGIISTEELLKECDCDNITKFIKINNATNQISDINDQIASAFVDKYYNSIFDDYWEGNNVKIPAFVEESTFWDSVFDEIIQEVGLLRKKYKL